MSSLRHKTCLRHRSCDLLPRNEPFDFLESDPPHFEIKPVLKAGFGLFTTRSFQKHEFIINYRGDFIDQQNSTDNIYSIETGAPEHVTVDASKRTECLGRYINDVDPFHAQNCRTVKIYNNNRSRWTIGIFATKNISSGEELRYSYGTKVAPWREMKFWKAEVRSKKNRIRKHPVPCTQNDVAVGASRNHKIADKFMEGWSPGFSHLPKRTAVDSGTVLPTETLQTETLQTETLPAETLQTETLQTETLQTETLETETLPAETLQTETLETETLPAETLQTETLPAETLPAETLPAETLQTETLQTETLETETLPAETLQTETLQTETLQTETLQTETLPAETLPTENLYISGIDLPPTQTTPRFSQIDLPPTQTTPYFSGTEIVIQTTPHIFEGADTSLVFMDIPTSIQTPNTNTDREDDADDDHDHEEEEEEEEEEIDSEIEFQTFVSKNNKPKRPAVETCLLCEKQVKKMRDHLTNKHLIGTNDKLRKFLSTYYSTLHTHRCYHCSDCSFRFGDRGKHPKNHPIERIMDRENMTFFPQSISVAIDQIRQQLLLPYKELVETWVRHEKGLFEDGDVSGTWNVSSTQFSFLCRAIDATKNFTEPTNLAVFVREYFQQRVITRSTMVNYLILFEKMVDYIKAYKRPSFAVIMENDWKKIIKDVRKKYQKGALKEKKRTKRGLFERVPDMEGVAFVVNRIAELCEADVKEETLSLDELKVFNFVTLSSTMNGRVGPLMDLTWEDVKKIKQDGKITSDKHKTGHFYDHELKIRPEQFPWLYRLRKEFEKKYGYRGKLVFATSQDTRDHSMAATIRKVLANHFEDHILEKDYHGTPIRKMWDTYFHYNADEIPAEARAFHSIQSAHTKDTADKNYIVPKTSGIDFYHDTLRKNAKSKAEIVDKSPSSTLPSTSKFSTPPVKSSPLTRTKTPSSETKPSVKKCLKSTVGSESSYNPSSSESESEKQPSSITIRKSTKYLKTLNTWRDEKPSPAVLKAVALFENIVCRMGRKEVVKTIEKAEIKLTREELSRVLNKVKWAGNQHLPKTEF